MPGAHIRRCGFSTGAPAFNPHTLSGLVLDFDQSDVPSWTESAGKMTQVSNRVTGISWTQAAGTAQAAVEPGWWHPDGGDFYLGTEAAVLDIVKNDTAHTVFAVPWLQTNPTPTLAFFGWGNSAVTTTYRTYGTIAAGDNWAALGNNGANANVQGTADPGLMPHVITFAGDGAATWSWVDTTADIVNAAQNLGALGTINRASLFTRPRSSNDIGFTGRFRKLLIYNRKLSDAEILQVQQYLYANYIASLPVIFFSGDSLSNGHLSASGVALFSRIVPSLPDANYRKGLAVNGSYLGAADGPDARYPLDITPEVMSRSGRKNIIHLWIGTNDLKLTVQTPAQIYARMGDYIDQAHADGFLVCLSRVTYRTSTELAGNGLNFNGQVDVLNTLVDANSRGADAIADPLTPLVNAGATADTAPNTYYVDTVHLTDAGYDLCMAAQATALNTLLP